MSWKKWEVAPGRLCYNVVEGIGDRFEWKKLNTAQETDYSDGRRGRSQSWQEALTQARWAGSNLLSNHSVSAASTFVDNQAQIKIVLTVLNTARVLLSEYDSIRNYQEPRGDLKHAAECV